MSTENVHALEGGMRDEDRAKAYRDELRPILEDVCEIVGRARKDGLQINFALGMDTMGRDVIQHLNISKPLL